MKDSPRNIHMIAICGTGMAAFAGMLKSSGYTVTGSDANIYPPMSTMLERQEIPVAEGYKPENIPSDTDLVVIGNAVSKDNPEVLGVLEKKIPYLSFPQALSKFFLEGKKSLVVAGTHGKTTTSSILAWVLESAGEEPGFMIGGWTQNFDANSRPGKGPYFVVEGDEYDTAFFDKGPKFLHYRPHAAMLTSLEFDHADIFKDLDHIKEAFRKFIRLIPKDGFLMAVKTDPNVKDVIGEAACPVIGYGNGEKEGWHAKKVRFGPDGVEFEIFEGDKSFGMVQSPLLGRHNLENAIGVFGLASRLGISSDAIKKGLKSFQGVKRRQEVVGEARGILVLDDFAHHPTAIRETLEGIRMKYAGRRLWAIFEPRSATSRRAVFQKDLPGAFEPADRIILANPFALDKIPVEERLDPGRVVEDLAGLGKDAEIIPTADEIVSRLTPRLKTGDVVCVMSSGGFDGIHKKLLGAIGE